MECWELVCVAPIACPLVGTSSRFLPWPGRARIIGFLSLVTVVPRRPKLPVRRGGLLATVTRCGVPSLCSSPASVSSQLGAEGPWRRHRDGVGPGLRPGLSPAPPHFLLSLDGRCRILRVSAEALNRGGIFQRPDALCFPSDLSSKAPH